MLADLGDFIDSKSNLLQLRFRQPRQIGAHDTIGTGLLCGNETVPQC